MPSRTVKGPSFTIVVDDKRILIEHVPAKGKRCRVSAPAGVLIEQDRRVESGPAPSSKDDPDRPEAK